MIDSLKWMLTKEEIEFEKKKFRGKLAGKSFKYSTNIDGLVRTRCMIFIMGFLALYPVFTNYAIHDVFQMNFLTERIIFASIIILSGVLFNKFRIFSIIMAVIPLLIITSTYFLVPGQFDLRTIAFMIASIVVILIGIYNHSQAKKIKIELENSGIESHLIDS